MAINDFLTACIREWSHKNYSVAMSCVCNAVDATAKKEYGTTKNKQRCLKFLNKYLDIITGVGFGGAILVSPGSTLRILNPLDPNKTENVTDIIYESLRCYLTHETSLPPNVEFTDRSFYGRVNNAFQIPTRLIAALFLAVVASPVNADISIAESCQLILDGKVVPINSLAGDALKVRQYLSLP
ncbi:MAG TPA: hypothetical protein PKB02_01210 [Anaerohalosphaeraceae bacterium]|nr:hypothetical protein [Anaerohalosphaeraceae bacterium]